MKTRRAVIVVVGLGLANAVHAQVLQGHPAGTGIASDGAGVFFNLRSIDGYDLSITGFDFYTWTPGTGVEVTVYTRPGGFDGFTTSPGAWTDRGATTVAATTGLAGMDFVDTPDFVVRAGGVTGVYFHIGTNGIGYGTSAQSSFRGRFIDDGHLQLEAGVSRSALFGGAQYGVAGTGPFRGFSGNVFYSVIPAPASLWFLGFVAMTTMRRRR